MRFMGADLVDAADESAAAPGRARISVLESGHIEVRFADSGNRHQSVTLTGVANDAAALLSRASSTVVIVASHRDDLTRAEGAGSFSGWTRVAVSDEASDAALGYAIGVGVQLP